VCVCVPWNIWLFILAFRTPLSSTHCSGTVGKPALSLGTCLYSLSSQLGTVSFTSFGSEIFALCPLGTSVAIGDLSFNFQLVEGPIKKPRGIKKKHISFVFLISP
jgi:hypothetical protein